MIVVDTNIPLYFYLPAGERSQQAEQALCLDSDWVAPMLWRSDQFVHSQTSFPKP